MTAVVSVGLGAALMGALALATLGVHRLVFGGGTDV